MRLEVDGQVGQRLVAFVAVADAILERTHFGAFFLGLHTFKRLLQLTRV